MGEVQHNIGEAFETREAALSTGRVRDDAGGDGPPLLNLHGAGGLRVSQALHDLTAWSRVFMPVVPGFDGEPFHDEVNSFPELCAMLAEFADQEIGAPSAVNGHAFGGRLSLWYTALQGDKVERLIVGCPSGLRPEGQGHLPLTDYSRAVQSHPERVPDEKRSQEIVTGNQFAGMSYHMPGKGVVDQSVLRDHALIERLGEISCPVLILQGAEDGVLAPASVEFLASQIPQARLVFVEGAGHLIDIDEPERFINLVRDFLAPG